MYIKKFTASMFMLLFSIFQVNVFAHDIQVQNEGVMIYYNWIRNHTELEVTYKGNSIPRFLGDGAYSGKVIIPEKINYNGVDYPVTRIGADAFLYSQNLIGVSLPQDLIDIGTSAFFGTAIYMNASDGVYYINKVACGYKGNVPSNKTLVIKAGTRAIADRAFSFGSGDITSLILPNSIIHIGKAAFVCRGLDTINLQSGNTIYDSRDNCNAIIETKSNKLVLGCKNSVIPEGIIEIGDYAFYESSITSIIIPNGVTEIGNFAFYGCPLKSIFIPKSVISIGKSAFENNSSYQSIISIDPENTFYDSRDNCNAIIETASNTLLFGFYNTTIPNSVTTIGYHAFIYKHFSSISIPNGVKKIDNLAFRGCSLEQLSLPNSVEVIGDSAFYACLELNTVTFSNKLKTIGEYAFSECGLTSVTIPEGITSLSYCMFRKCNKISSVILPNSLKEYGGSVFAVCSAIKNVYNYSEVPVSMNSNIFTSSISSATLHVPQASIIDYNLAEPWGSFGNIVALTDGDPKPTGIKSINQNTTTSQNYYSLDGKHTATTQRGLNLIKMSDGTTMKVVVK